MLRTRLTYVFCLDEHRSFAEEVRKRFSDTSKYRVIHSVTQDDFLKSFIEEKEHRNCKIAILTVHETKDHGHLFEGLIREILKVAPGTGVILVYPPDRSEEIKKAVIFNIDARIPKNANTMMRLHNEVKKLISEHNLEIRRKKRNLSIYILLAFLIISAILLLVAYLKLPEYF